MLNSDEFKSKNVSNRDKIIALYHTILQREPTNAELLSGTIALSSSSRNPFTSDEHKANGLARIADQMLTGQEYQDMVAAGKAPSLYPSDTIADGEIDYFKQGSLNDCWLLSSINAVSKDENGRALLKQMITNNGDGSYTVVFPGDPNNKWTVTSDDLKDDPENPRFSTGDLDTRILEVAAEQYRLKDESRDLNLGTTDYGIKLLTGQVPETLWPSSLWSITMTEQKLKDKLIEFANHDQDGLTLTFSLSAPTDDQRANPGNENDETLAITSKHALAITSIDAANNTISFQDPYHTGDTQTISLDAFVAAMHQRGMELPYLEVAPPQ